MKRLTMTIVVVALVIQSVAAFEYGNWCGPYHPKNPSEDPEPINEVDAACRNHDLAMAAKGSLSGEADAAMVTELVELLNSGRLSTDEFAAAVVIATYMNGQQQVTVYQDVFEGKVSSYVKVALTTQDAQVTLPASVTAQVLNDIATEIGGPGGKLLGSVVIVLRAPVTILRELGNAIGKVLGW